MQGVPATDPTWNTVAETPPQPIIAEPETAATEPLSETKPVLVVVWLVVVAGVMWAAMPVAFLTAVVLYGWEQPGLIREEDGVALPIMIGTAVYLVMCVLPVVAGRLAFPVRRLAMTVIGLLTPAVGLGAAWLFFVVR